MNDMIQDLVNQPTKGTDPTAPLKIICDFDNVISDLDNLYAPFVRHIIPDFSEAKHIVEWNMPQVELAYPEAFDIIKGLWSSPEFMGSLELVPKSIEALRYLGKLEEAGKIRLMIYTAVVNDDVATARANQLDKIFDLINHEFVCHQNIGLRKTPINNFDVIIEDSQRNLVLSNVPHKVLINRGNNRFTTYRDIGEYKSFNRFNSLYEFVNSRTFQKFISK